MENPQIEILNILKIDKRIKQNLFGLNFNDENIEKLYLESEKEINLKIKLIMHVSYILNIAFKFYQAKYNDIIWVFVFQIFCAIICLFSTIFYYISKDGKKKKNFHNTISYINYINQIIIVTIPIFFKENPDEITRLKSANVLLLISISEILFGYESIIFFPFIILIVNSILNIVVFIIYKDIIKNLAHFFAGGISIITSLLFKRYINQLNRKNFINHYIFKKCSYYYQDIIDKMNGYQLTIRDNKIINSNQNFKLDIFNFNNEYNQFINNQNLNNYQNKNNINNNNSLSILIKNMDMTNNNLGFGNIINEEKDLNIGI